MNHVHFLFLFSSIHYQHMHKGAIVRIPKVVHVKVNDTMVLIYGFGLTHGQVVERIIAFHCSLLAQ